MLKRIYILLFISFFSVCSFAQHKEFVLKGEIADLNKEGWMVYLQSLDRFAMGKPVSLDSTVIKNGNFVFNGFAPKDPEFYFISSYEGSESNGKEDLRFFFIVEPGIIQLKMDGRGVSSIVGFEENEKHNVFLATQAGLLEEVEEMVKLQLGGDESAVVSQSLLEWQASIEKRALDAVFTYTKANMSNRMGEFYFMQYHRYLSADRMKELYNLARSDFKKAEGVSNIIDNLPTDLSIGAKFEGLKLQRADKGAGMDSYIGKGKVVLIDFWASWCPPCRREMPELIAMYNRLRADGLEVIGISLDDKDQAWKDGIEAMKIPWPNYSDLGGWGGVVARKYNVSSIPQNYLLDREGKIVAHNLKGLELERKIKELLAK